MARILIHRKQVSSKISLLPAIKQSSVRHLGISESYNQKSLSFVPDTRF